MANDGGEDLAMKSVGYSVRNKHQKASVRGRDWGFFET